MYTHAQTYTHIKHPNEIPGILGATRSMWYIDLGLGMCLFLYMMTARPPKNKEQTSDLGGRRQLERIKVSHRTEEKGSVYLCDGTRFRNGTEDVGRRLEGRIHKVSRRKPNAREIMPNKSYVIFAT